MSTTETNTQQTADSGDACEHCGTTLAGGRYCPGCGRPLSSVAETAPPENLEAANPDGQAPGAADQAAEPEIADPPPYAEQDSTIAEPAADDSPPTEPIAPRFGDTPPRRESAGARPDDPPPHRSAATPPPESPSAAVSSASPQRPRRGLLIGAAIAVVLAGGGVAAVLLLTSKDDGSSADTAYRQQVAKAFGPVLGANRELSNQLGRVRGTKPTDARVAARRAQQATTLATGAVGALNAPAGSDQLSRDARQVLDREGAYVSAVSAVLANPSSTSRSQLVTLASNLTSALSAAGPTVAGTSQTVSGADHLASWAPGAARTLKHRRERKQRKESPNPSGSKSAPAPSAPNPLQSGRSCGSGVYAGPNTSCEFAFNVRDAYYDAPGRTASLRVFSPVTGVTYTMNCAPSGSGVTCSGANNASVAF